MVFGIPSRPAYVVIYWARFLILKSSYWHIQVPVPFYREILWSSAERPINANDGSKIAACNKSKTHVIRSVFCTDTFHPPGSGPQQRKTYCKTDMHLKKAWSKIIVTIKRHLPARATSHYIPQENVPVGQAYSNGFLFFGAHIQLSCRFRPHCDTLCAYTFHPPASRECKPNMRLNLTWTTIFKKKRAPPLAFLKKKIYSGPRLSKRVPDFTAADIQVPCRFHILQMHLPPSQLQTPDPSSTKHVAKQAWLKKCARHC